MTYEELEAKIHELRLIHKVIGHERRTVCSCGHINDVKLKQSGLEFLQSIYKDTPVKYILYYLVKNDNTTILDTSVLRMLSEEEIKFIFANHISWANFANLCDVNPNYLNMFYKRFKMQEIVDIIQQHFEVFEAKEEFLKNFKVSKYYLKKIIYHAPNPRLIKLLPRLEYKLNLWDCKPEYVEKIYQFIQSRRKIPLIYSDSNILPWLLEKKYYGLAFIIGRRATIRYILETFGEFNPQSLKVAHKFDKKVLEVVRLTKLGNEIVDNCDVVFWNGEFYRISFYERLVFKRKTEGI